MSRTRLQSELLATMSLSAGDKLAVAAVLAALFAFPNRTGEPRGVEWPHAPDDHDN